MRWLDEHSLRRHIFGPLWLRIPERRRWSIVGLLNKSRHFCWSDLVTAALGWHEVDACETHLPTIERAPRCASICDWMSDDHRGAHACSCYCGKFRFDATEGSADRRGVSS